MAEKTVHTRQREKEKVHDLELKDPKSAPCIGTCNCLAVSRKNEDKSMNKVAQSQETENEANMQQLMVLSTRLEGKLTIAKHHMSERSGASFARCTTARSATRNKSTA